MVRVQRRNRSRGQRGEGMIGCLLWAAVLIVAVVIAWEAVPVKVASASLYDYMEEVARFPGRKSEARIKKDLIKKAADLNIELEPKNVEVQKTRDRIKMKVTYTVPLEFPGYTYYWDFDQSIDRPIFIF